MAPILIVSCASTGPATIMPSAASDTANFMSRFLPVALSACEPSRLLHAQAVDAFGGGDVEAAQIVVTPAEIGRVLRHLQDAEQAGIGREDMDAAGTAAIEIAGSIDFHAVGGAGRRADGL